MIVGDQIMAQPFGRQISQYIHPDNNSRALQRIHAPQYMMLKDRYVLKRNNRMMGATIHDDKKIIRNDVKAHVSIC